MPSEFPSADEIQVAEILLQLPQMILRYPILADWGSKRRRSAPNREKDDLPSKINVDSLPPQEKVKAEATSPATPLSFSPSESDSKRKHRKRNSLHHHKKKRADWLEIIDGLTQRRELMLKEIENVSRYYDKLKTFNLQLKARKEELISIGLNVETPVLKEGQSSSLVIQFNQQKDNNQRIHHPPSNQDRTVQIQSIDYDVSPLGIPDLNVPVDETFAVDSFQSLDSSNLVYDRNYSRAIASEARRKRIQIYRAKNSISANKQRYLM